MGGVEEARGDVVRWGPIGVGDGPSVRQHTGQRLHKLFIHTAKQMRHININILIW